MKELRSDHIHKILIRSTNWIGDAVMTTPAVRAIRKNFPAARIDLLAKPWVAPVFYNNPHVDHILLYDGLGEHKGLRGKWRLAAELRYGAYDAAILLQNAFEAALLAYLARIPVRLGYDTDGRRLLLTHPVHRHPRFKQIHETQYYLEMLKAANLASDGTDLTVVVDRQEVLRGEAFLRKNGVGPRDLVVGVNPGATFGTAKRWPLDRFVALCEKLYRSYDARIVIFGGPAEKEAGDRMARCLGFASVNLCGRTTLREAMALVACCGLFITNDSGLMHVAAALNVPLVAVFGSTNPITTGPITTGPITTGPHSAHSRIVRSPVPCSPCLKPDCPTDHRCMSQVSVDAVFDAAGEFLKDRG